MVAFGIYLRASTIHPRALVPHSCIESACAASADDRARRRRREDVALTPATDRDQTSQLVPAEASSNSAMHWLKRLIDCAEQADSAPAQPGHSLLQPWQAQHQFAQPQPYQQHDGRRPGTGAQHDEQRCPVSGSSFRSTQLPSFMSPHRISSPVFPDGHYRSLKDQAR